MNQLRNQKPIWRSKRLFKQAVRNKVALSMGFTNSKYFYCTNIPSYKAYLQTDHWKNISHDYKIRFPVCEDCRKLPSLDVHHRNYQNLGKEKYWDLLALCRKCHFSRHKANSPFFSSK